VTIATERAFVVFARGQKRDEMLAQFRIGLRQLVNPETGVLFTEDETRRAVQQGGRFWREAEAIDLLGQAEQARALWLADQVRLDRASHSWLVGYHGRLWEPENPDPLPAFAGSGPADASASTGTIFIGSTTVPDPAAHVARDAQGNRYQVLTTVATPVSGVAALTFIGIDVGPQTNAANGTVLTWENQPLGALPTCTTTTTFTGGVPAEDDAAYASRLRARVAHKPGAGNNSHFRGWARQASNAIRDAYIYACAFNAGSVLVCITGKRTGVGPQGLMASAGALAAATAYLVPPNSPVVPERAFVVVLQFAPQASHVVLQLQQPKGNDAGWRDFATWPTIFVTGGAAAAVTTVTDQLHFRMRADSPGGTDSSLPGGVEPPLSMSGLNAPHLMLWNENTSAFEELNVASVIHVAASSNYDVVLNAPPGFTITVGSYVSPSMKRRDALAQAAADYYDGLGPGEAVDLETDVRADRAVRFPEATEEAPWRGGQAIITAISDALGSSLSNAFLHSMTPSVPAVPADIMTGPRKLILGKLGVYELP
jgi:hypothetical protein